MVRGMETGNATETETETASTIDDRLHLRRICRLVRIRPILPFPFLLASLLRITLRLHATQMPSLLDRSMLRPCPRSRTSSVCSRWQHRPQVVGKRIDPLRTAPHCRFDLQDRKSVV